MGMQLNGLEGKVAVVTGAGRMRSIGRAIAMTLAENGCDVVITGSGRDPATFPEEERRQGWRDIESVAEDVRKAGRRALPVVCDVSSEPACADLLARVVAEFGRVDFVINNASAARGPDRRPVVELDPALWRTVIDVNLNGAFYMCHHFGKQLIAQGEGGVILNISSVAGKMLAPNHAAYSASKAALQGLTASMAGEVGRHGIRVNAICPGIVDTSRLDDIPRSDGTWDQLIRQYIPLGRAGRAEEIAWLAAFLCSEQASWISGQFYTIDGGQVTGR